MRIRCSRRTSCRFLYGISLGFVIGFFTSEFFQTTFHRTPETIPAPSISTARHRTTSTNAYPRQDSTRDDLIFVAVVTTRKHLHTRAEALYKTWGSTIPGRMVFYVGAGEEYNTSLPVEVLPDVPDDVYPPLRKAFAMLKHVSTKYGKDFTWFIRSDDDVYVNMKRLLPYLHKKDPSKDVYMGYPGRGSVGEMGKLGIHKPYCCGGPGVIFSRSLLRKISLRADRCVNETVTTHEDTELGRCVEAVSRLPCVPPGSSSLLISHVDQTGAWTLKLSAKRANSISFHPMKEPKNMYLFHSRFK